MKKRIILGLPTDNSINSAIQSNLENLGFEVINVSFDIANFKYKNFGQRIHNFFRKTFLKDKNFKKRLKYNNHRQELENQLNHLHPKADYALLIRPDIYPTEFLEKIRQKVGKMYGYHWDGLALYPLTRDVIPYFDSFYVFDPKDYPHPEFPNVKPTTSFYIDHVKTTENPENDIYYIGFMMKKRMPSILRLLEKIKPLNLKLDINLLTKDLASTSGLHKNINFFTEPMTYQQNLERMMNSKVILDFLDSSHGGLSLRTFEAVGFGKKLVTNNPSVKYYDFYNPANIFVWDGENPYGIEEFLKKPYEKLPEQIVKKYGFTNWINYILEIEPHQKIEFPAELINS